MFYVALFILFISCIVFLVKIYQSIDNVSSSIDVVTSSIEKLRLDQSDILNDILNDVAICHCYLKEFDKVVGNE